MNALEEQLNHALHSRLPAKLKRHRHKLAIDLHLIHYYGTPNDAEEPYIYRSQAKSGTTHFFAYASLYVICRNKRVTLAIHPVDHQETLVATLTYLLSTLTPLKLRWYTTPKLVDRAAPPESSYLAFNHCNAC